MDGAAVVGRLPSTLPAWRVATGGTAVPAVAVVVVSGCAIVAALCAGAAGPRVAADGLGAVLVGNVTRGVTRGAGLAAAVGAAVGVGVGAGVSVGITRGRRTTGPSRSTGPWTLGSGVGVGVDGGSEKSRSAGAA